MLLQICQKSKCNLEDGQESFYYHFPDRRMKEKHFFFIGNNLSDTLSVKRMGLGIIIKMEPLQLKENKPTMNRSKKPAEQGHKCHYEKRLYINL